MKNNLIDKLGITNLESGLITLVSSVGIGRTTLLCIAAAEFYHDGKNVLFLTQESDERTIMKKIKRSLHDLPPNLNLCSLKIKNVTSTLNEVIKTQFAATNYDIVIIDGSITNSFDYEFLRELSHDKKCLIFTAIQTRIDAIFETPIPPIPNESLYKSDMVIGIGVTKPNKPSFWTILKYFLCFWLKKPEVPNRTLKIIKNRYGRDGVLIDLNMDFENVKIK